MKVRLVLAVSLFLAVAVGLLIGVLSGSRPAVVSASSGVAAPLATSTPRPTAVPRVLKFPQIYVRSNWATPANAWADVKSQLHLDVPLCSGSNINISFVETVAGNDYGLLTYTVGSGAGWLSNFDSPPTSGRVSVLGAEFGGC